MININGNSIQITGEATVYTAEELYIALKSVSELSPVSVDLSLTSIDSIGAQIIISYLRSINKPKVIANGQVESFVKQTGLVELMGG